MESKKANTKVRDIKRRLEVIKGKMEDGPPLCVLLCGPLEWWTRVQRRPVDDRSHYLQLRKAATGRGFDGKAGM